MSVEERKMAKKWIESHLKEHPEDYAFRIHDCPWGVKVFDYFLFRPMEVWALEFKVDRRKVFRYSVEELPPHQRRELSHFSNGQTRKSFVVVFHPLTKEVHRLEVPSARSQSLVL